MTGPPPAPDFGLLWGHGGPACNPHTLIEQDDPAYADIHHVKCSQCGAGFHKCAVEMVGGVWQLRQFAAGKTRRARRKSGL